MSSRSESAPAPPANGAAATRSIDELTPAECQEVLRRQRLCVLALVDGSTPYAVPVYYGFDGCSLYLGVSLGRKTRVLDDNPLVHLVVTETADGDRWRSVAIAGRATLLADPGERAHAIEALIAHNRRADRANADGERATPTRRSGGRVFRIDEVSITGRARR